MCTWVRFWRLWEKRVGVDIPKDSLGCDTSNGHNTLLTVNTGIKWMDPDNFDTTRSHSRRVLGRITPASMPSTAVKRVMTSALAGVDKDVIRKDISGNFDVLGPEDKTRNNGNKALEHRRWIKRNPKLVKIINKFWENFPRDTVSVREVADLAKKLAKALSTNLTAAAYRFEYLEKHIKERVADSKHRNPEPCAEPKKSKSYRKEWKYHNMNFWPSEEAEKSNKAKKSCLGYRLTTDSNDLSITKEWLCDFLFDIVDIWCLDVHPHKYVDTLDALYEKVAAPRANNNFKGWKRLQEIVYDGSFLGGINEDVQSALLDHTQLSRKETVDRLVVKWSIATVWFELMSYCRSAEAEEILNTSKTVSRIHSRPIRELLEKKGLRLKLMSFLRKEDSFPTMYLETLSNRFGTIIKNFKASSFSWWRKKKQGTGRFVSPLKLLRSRQTKTRGRSDSTEDMKVKWLRKKKGSRKPITYNGSIKRENRYRTSNKSVSSSTSPIFKMASGSPFAGQESKPSDVAFAVVKDLSETDKNISNDDQSSNKGKKDFNEGPFTERVNRELIGIRRRSTILSYGMPTMSPSGRRDTLARRLSKFHLDPFHKDLVREFLSSSEDEKEEETESEEEEPPRLVSERNYVDREKIKADASKALARHLKLRANRERVEGVRRVYEFEKFGRFSNSARGELEGSARHPSRGVINAMVKRELAKKRRRPKIPPALTAHTRMSARAKGKYLDYIALSPRRRS
ncbi:hypothetical protein AAMO2058_000640600 [Amorphochlora amoebiformis]